MVALPPSLRFADFRVLLASTALGGIGFRGQLVTVGWLVLEESDSPVLVGIGVSAFLAPNALVGILGGAVTDRFDRRFVLRLTGLALALNTLLLGVLTLDDVNIPQVLLLSVLGGGFWSLTQTARQSYAYDVVGAERAVNGLALISLAQRIGGVGGALLAGGALAAWGPGETYLLLAAALLLSALAMFAARARGAAAPVATQPVLQNLREYAGELKSNTTLAWLALLTAGVEVFGFSHLSALPVLVRDELGGDGGDLGLVSAFSSAGGIVAMVLFASRSGLGRRGVLFLGVVIVYGLAVILLGASQTLLMAMLAATAVSALASLSDVLSQVLVQLAVPNEMRGRAMGTWALAIGTAPAGHLQMGALTSWLGVGAALTLNGAVLIAVAVAAGVLVGRLRRL